MIAASASRVLGSSSTINTCGMRLEFIQSVEGHTAQKASWRSLGRCYESSTPPGRMRTERNSSTPKDESLAGFAMAPDCVAQLLPYSELITVDESIIRLYQDETHGRACVSN